MLRAGGSLQQRRGEGVVSLSRNGKISTLDQSVDKKKYDENYDRIFGEWKPKGLRGRIHIEDRFSVLDSHDSSISSMMRDRTMVRMIRDGKANDRGLKREAELIERENSDRPRQLYYARKHKELQSARIELRRSQRV